MTALLSHAPAPWRIDSSWPGSFFIKDAANRTIVLVSKEDDEREKLNDTETIYRKIKLPHAESHAQLITQIPAMILALRAIVDEHENLEDQAPADVECIECNLGTGPHKRTCAYHQARAILKTLGGI